MRKGYGNLEFTATSTCMRDGPKLATSATAKTMASHILTEQSDSIFSNEATRRLTRLLPFEMAASDSRSVSSAFASSFTAFGAALAAQQPQAPQPASGFKPGIDTSMMMNQLNMGNQQMQMNQMGQM